MEDTVKTMPFPIAVPRRTTGEKPPVFTSETLERYARYLAEADGIEHYDFYLRNGLPDLAGARTFAEEMRRQVGVFLDQVITIEQKVNRVFVVLREDWQRAAIAAIRPF